MAKKKRNKEERKAQRIQAKRDRKWEGKTESAFKEEQAADLEKVKAADASYKASKKAKKDTEKAQRRGQGSEIKKSAVTPSEVPVSQEPRVMRVTKDPETGEQIETQYRNIADYTRNNPEPENVTETISGNAPVPETIKQVSQNQPTFNPKEVEEAANNVEQSVDNVSKEVEKQDYALNLQEQEIAREEGEEPRAVAEGHDRGRAAREAADAGHGQYELTDEQYAKMAQDFRTGLAAAKASAPATAIEQLGIEHYYPPQKDFITANFTGSYIGSRQLVAGTGALFPVGLLDARNRATQAKAKDKAEREEKFWELSTTSPQYDERYKDVGMDILEKYYTLSGGNLDELMNGKSKLSLQFRRDMYDYNSRGAHLVEVMTNIKSITDNLNTGKGEKMYVPPHMYDQMMSVVEGTKDMDAFFKGEAVGDKELRAISNYVRSYENFNVHAKNWITTIKDQPDTMPLRKDVDWSNPVNAENLQEAITRYGSNRDWNEYQMAIGKYFDMERLDEMVSGIERETRVYTGESEAEAKQLHQDRVRMMVASLGSEVDIERWNTATNALGWTQEANRERDRAWKRKTYRDQWISMWEGFDRQLSGQDPTTKGASMPDVAGSVLQYSDPKDRSRKFYDGLLEAGMSPAKLGGFSVAKINTQATVNEGANANELNWVGRDGNLYPVPYAKQMLQEKVDAYAEKHNLTKDTKSGRYESKVLDELYEQIGEFDQIIKQNNNQHIVNERYGGYSAKNDKGELVPMEFAREGTTKEDLVNTAYYSGKVGLANKKADGSIDVQDGTVQMTQSKGTYVTRHNMSSQEFWRTAPQEDDTQENRNRYWTLGPDGVTLQSESEGGSTLNPLYGEGSNQ